MVLPGLPFNAQRIAALNGSPRVAGDDGDLARVLVSHVGIGGDFEDIENTGDGFGSACVEAEQVAAEIGTLGDDRVDHARNANVEPKPGYSFHLVGDIEVRNRAAEKSEVFRVLQPSRCWGQEAEGGARL